MRAAVAFIILGLILYLIVTGRAARVWDALLT